MFYVVCRDLILSHFGPPTKLLLLFAAAVVIDISKDDDGPMLRASFSSMFMPKKDAEQEEI
jgi:hypothetical protein